MAISLREFTDINPPMFQDREAPPEVAVDEVSITPEQPKSTVSMGGEAGKYLKEMQPFLEAEKKAQADKDIFASELKGQELASQAKKSERMADVTRTQKSSLEGSQEFQDLKQAEDELMKKGEFVPTQDTAKDLGGLFSLIGVIGWAIGGSGKENSIQAMSAMNGMLSGYQKGRSDLYKREKDIFDTNMKALQIKTTILSNRLKQVAELYALDAKAGDQEADALFNKEQATFYKQYKDKFGLPAVVELAKRNTEAFKDAKNYELKLKEMAAKKEKEKGGYTSALLAGRAENIREAFVQAAQDLENVSRFPKNTVLGTFAGMTGLEGNNLMTSLSRTFTRQIGSTESRMLQQLVSGLETNLAMALGGGYATSAAKYKIDQYKTQIPKQGDDGWVTATFLARIRQELNILSDNFPTKPGATPEMSAAVKASNDKINRVIPFTVEDITNAKFGTKETVAQKSQSMIEKPKTLEEFLVKARAKNPNASDEQLTNFYYKKYGVQK
jgi:hypothetical protein